MRKLPLVTINNQFKQQRMNQINPSKIMQIGLGFWASKTLLTAVNLNLFSHLAEGKKSGIEIQKLLGLHDRSLYDFLDTLVALQFLNRKGLKETSTYSNSEETDLFLDKNKLTYMGGLLEMANNRLYPFWNNLEVGLKTGKPQNESQSGEASMFEAIYADPQTLKEFLHAMGGIQAGNFDMFARNYNFSTIQTHCDIGGLLLIFVEIVIMNFLWWFNPYYEFINLQVIWAIGLSMIFLAALIHIPKKIILILSLIIVFGHNLLDTIAVEGNSFSSVLWYVFHQKKNLFLENGHMISFYYPFLPWIAVMALGYCFGLLYHKKFDAKKRKRILLILGFSTITLFLLIRVINTYGDMLPWSK